MNEDKQIEEVLLTDIVPNIYQPRLNFDENSLKQLTDSVDEYGIIQPLILRKKGNKYEIIDGERRYKSARKLGLDKVPAIILNLNDKQVAEYILTENTQKQLLSPLEEANAYQQMMLLNKMNIDELALKVKKDKNYLNNKLNLLKLPIEVQEGLLQNKISEGHAKLLTKVPAKEDQIDLYNKIVKERITIQKLEEILSKEVKKEEEDMDNSQLNFNQYNNLLNEQEKPQMVVPDAPAPIIGNTISEPKNTDFFPSLEEQPLNSEVPLGNAEIPPIVEMPQIDIPAPSVPPMEQPVVPPQNMVQPPMETPSIPNLDQTVVAPTPMPTFEAPAPSVPTFDQPVAAPQNIVQSPIEMPTIEMPTPSVPTMEPAPIEMPSFEVPAPSAPAIEQPPVAPAPMGIPTFEMPAPNPTPQEQPQAVPTMEAPQTQPITDVMPAVNMIRNLIPLLENSGYQVAIEENDNPTEYKVIINLKK